MKRSKFLAVLAATALGTALVQAQTNNYVFSFTANQVIPDADANGLALATNLSGLKGVIADLTVFLDVTNGFNGNLYAYLTGPNSGFAVLLNRVGVSNAVSIFGYADAGFSITLSDDAAHNVHYYRNFSPTFNSGGQLTDVWQPDGVNIDPMTNDPSAFLTAGRTAMLSSFWGSDPNGRWTLFVADLPAGQQSTLVSWGLNMMTVPEPAAWALAAMGVAIISVCPGIRRRPRRLPK